MLGHLRQPITTRIPPLAERKDRNDGKSSPPRYLTAACRTMMTLSLPQHHYDKPKSSSTIKGDKASDIIKRHSCKERRYAFPLRKKERLIIKEKTNKTIEGCIRTICPDVFCRLVEARIIFGWKGAFIMLLWGSWWRRASTLAPSVGNCLVNNKDVHTFQEQFVG